MFTLYVKSPCNPDCDCNKDGGKKECKCDQRTLIEMPKVDFPRR